MLSSYTFTALQPGPRLLVMGALHGNEYAGAKAIERVIAALQAQPERLGYGSVTLLPVANPAAYAQRARYLTVNPNRIFRRHATPTLYEECLVDRLCDLIDECDYLLDIHSFTAPIPHNENAPFIFLNTTDTPHLVFAEALGIPYILTGWAALAGAASDSEGYAASQGKISLTLECGQQDDPRAIDIAEAAIWRSLAHLRMSASQPDPRLPHSTAPQQLRLRTRTVKAQAGQLTAGLTHLQPVAAGELLATYADGTQLTAPTAATMILPKADARIGDEWYYLAS